MSVAADLSATAILGTAISVVYWLLKQWWIDAQYGVYLPPGPRRIPLLGNAHQLGLSDQHITLAEWGKHYGESTLPIHSAEHDGHQFWQAM